MFSFQKAVKTYKLPVFYLQLPEAIKGTSIALTVFTGSADDSRIGSPGLFHWLEHVPFRGTDKYPYGYASTKGEITRRGGRLGAWTNMCCTNYWATVPNRSIDVGMDMLTELVVNPNLQDVDIKDERQVIHQEIRNKLGSAGGTMQYLLPSLLWGDHPFGVPTLGSSESLDSMAPEDVRAAHVEYDCSRMVCVIASAEEYFGEMRQQLAELSSKLPDRGLSERRRGASYGELPKWKGGTRTVLKTQFKTTVVKVLFPSKPFSTWEEYARQALLKKLFCCGGLGSPLYKRVREDNPMAYNASVISHQFSDTECWGFHVETSQQDAMDVEMELMKLLSDRQLRSKEWFSDVQECLRGEMETEVIDPTSIVADAVKLISYSGDVITSEEFIQRMCAISYDEIMAALDELSLDQAYAVTALGLG